MTTVRDAVAAAKVAAAGGGGPRPAPDTAGAAPAHDARARVRVTDGDDKSPGLLALIWSDWRGAWWRTAEPMTRAEVVANRIPSPDRVPDGSPPLRWGWAAWMHAVAIPVTWVLLPPAGMRPWPLRQLLRGLVWVFQHPARFALAAPIVGALTWMWIAG